MPATISRAAYADMFGPTTGDKVRLADTDLIIEVERDLTTYGEEVKFGGGKDHDGVIFLITIGTGLGTVIISDGHLVPNTELGHIILHGDSAEKYASDAVRKSLDLSWKKWAKRFDEYLHEICRLFWPDLIVLGGGASKKHDKFFKYLTVDTEVVPAQLLNQAGLIGGALFAEINMAKKA